MTGPGAGRSQRAMAVRAGAPQAEADTRPHTPPSPCRSPVAALAVLLGDPHPLPCAPARARRRPGRRPGRASGTSAAAAGGAAHHARAPRGPRRPGGVARTVGPRRDTAPVELSCSVVAGDRTAYARGHWARHDRQLLRDGAVRPDRSPRPCVADGCGRPAAAEAGAAATTSGGRGRATCAPTSGSSGRCADRARSRAANGARTAATCRSPAHRLARCGAHQAGRPVRRRRRLGHGCGNRYSAEAAGHLGLPRDDQQLDPSREEPSQHQE